TPSGTGSAACSPTERAARTLYPRKGGISWRRGRAAPVPSGLRALCFRERPGIGASPYPPAIRQTGGNLTAPAPPFNFLGKNPRKNGNSAFVLGVLQGGEDFLGDPEASRGVPVVVAAHVEIGAARAEQAVAPGQVTVAAVPGIR